MTDEIKLQQDVTRAHRAKLLVENDLLGEAFSELEKSYIEFWRQTKPEDQLGREKIFLAVNVIGKVKDHLHSIINSGSLAKAELEKLNAEAERKKRFRII